MQAALDQVTTLTGSRGRVLPMVNQPLNIEAEVAGLDDDPRVMRPVRGQVAVATTPGQVRRVHLLPDSPQANPRALQALNEADIITLGPGSWFSSVLPHLLVPQIVEDRKSTRLNSSHVAISYAVFCLKKKKKKREKSEVQ